MADVAATAPGKAGNLLKSALGPIVFALVVVALWKAAVTVFAVPPYIMPPPEATLAAFEANLGKIGISVALTLRNAAAGLVVAFLVAIGLAALFVNSQKATHAVLPIVIGLRTAPVLAIAPILIMVFGRGIGTAIVVVVIVSFFPIMVNAMKGFSSTRKNALELMHVLGASRVQLFLKVRFPFALPFIFAGLRSAATSAILSAMLAEWLSGAPGLGSLILDAASYRKNDLLWAAVVVSMLLAYLIFSMTTLVEKRLTSWRS